MREVLDWKKPYHRFFEEMSRIPHGSFHEKAYSDYLVKFAKERGLSCKQYEIGNVIIYKPGTAGYEGHETVVLQAHMDMVWEKTPDSAHVFETDPLELYIEDGWLHARGTTLGADDGAGVAYILSVLDDEKLSHPPLECIFTVQEEVGLMGAYALEPEDIKGRRFISLDDGGGGIVTTIASAGGLSWKGTRSLEREENRNAIYRLSVGGLTGGHSGECISQEKGNAIRLCCRILEALQDHGELLISEIDGGDKDNAIPRSCEAGFYSDLPYEEVRRIVEETQKKILEEYRYSDEGFTARVEEMAGKPVCVQAVSDELLGFLLLAPDGMRHHSMRIPGLTTASANLASVKTEESSVTVHISLRAAGDSWLDEMEHGLKRLAALFHMEGDSSSRYPAWEFQEESVMQQVMKETVKACMNRELKFLAVHGGLECGVFKQKWPDMDMVTLGPVGKDVHTPDERLDLESFDVCYGVLTEFLRRL